MSLFDKLVVQVSRVPTSVFLNDVLSDVISVTSIVQTVLNPTAKAILPTCTTCVFSKAEYWACFVWATWYNAFGNIMVL